MKLLLLTLLILGAGMAEAQDTVKFAGKNWCLRDYDGGPGPNDFAKENVHVDEKGALHLKLRQKDGTWTTAEAICEGTSGYGVYECQIEAPIATLDPQVVFGFFLYPTQETGKSGTHEIDIELARWGNPKYPNLNFTVWPVNPELKQASGTHEIKFTSVKTFHRFTWLPGRVTFEVFDSPGPDESRRIASWTYAPEDHKDRVSSAKLQMFFNLWLFEGKPPKDGKDVEVIIHEFRNTPAPAN